MNCFIGHMHTDKSHTGKSRPSLGVPRREASSTADHANNRVFTISRQEVAAALGYPPAVAEKMLWQARDENLRALGGPQHSRDKRSDSAALGSARFYDFSSLIASTVERGPY